MLRFGLNCRFRGTFLADEIRVDADGTVPWVIVWLGTGDDIIGESGFLRRVVTVYPPGAKGEFPNKELVELPPPRPQPKQDMDFYR